MEPINTFMGQWIYKDEVYEPDADVVSKDFPYQGFVYIIENLANGRSYMGKKGFTFGKTRQVNKKKKRFRAESDWRDYYGSSEALLKDVEYFGKERFRRTILHLCRSKGEASYLEAYEQFSRNVLLREDYYNTWISCRVRNSHLKLLREDYSCEE